MPEPVAFVSHFRIKEGKLDAFRRLSGEAAQRLEADKPRTLVFLGFLDDRGAELAFIHVFADAESMDLHVQGAAERSSAAYEYLVPLGWEIYGRLSAPALEMMRQEATTAGVTMTHQPDLMVGFLRLQPA